MDWPEPGITQKALATFAYTRFRVNETHVEAFDVHGKKIDEVTVR